MAEQGARYGGRRKVAEANCDRDTPPVEGITWPLVAVMGCVVNGPGEAREADIALVCGKNKVFLYIAGEKAAALDARSAPAVVAEKALEFRTRKAGFCS